MRPIEASTWRCAVIESNPPQPVFVFDSPEIASAAGVGVGSAIRLPTADIDTRWLEDIAGSVSYTTMARLELAIANAIQAIDRSK